MCGKKKSPGHAVLLAVFICLLHSMTAQDCPSKQDLQNSIQQTHKLLSAQEASFTQTLRSLRKKLDLLHDNVSRLPAKPKNLSCPSLEAPAHGRRLGQIRLPGHEVHFQCEPGFELLGSETRRCQASLSWSGTQPICRDVDECVSSPCANGGTCVNELRGFSCVCASGWAGSVCQEPSASVKDASAVSVGAAAAFVQRPNCSLVQGSSFCSCEPGYTLSARDSSVCTDIDECTLFHNGPAGRLCLHTCVNTAGGYRCSCPAGYSRTRDGRGCTDRDECRSRQNNCTRDQLCINTYGGFQCVTVDCPQIQSATYTKTSPVRCERNPCPADSRTCSQMPVSVSHHHLALVSGLSAPRVLFRLSAGRMMGDALRFALLGPAQLHFSLQRFDRRTGELMLTRTLQGPATLELELEMSELRGRALLARYVTKLKVFVSQYEF